jgi:hypothetical protein
MNCFGLVLSQVVLGLFGACLGVGLSCCFGLVYGLLFLAFFGLDINLLFWACVSCLYFFESGAVCGCMHGYIYVCVCVFVCIYIHKYQLLEMSTAPYINTYIDTHTVV